MITSPISQEMLQCFMQLNDEEQKSVLQMVKTFLSSRNNDFKPGSIEEYNREVEQGDAEIEAGNYVPHEEVMKRYLK